MHPGVIQTNLGRHMSGPVQWGIRAFTTVTRWIPALRMKTIPQVTACCAGCAAACVSEPACVSLAGQRRRALLHSWTAATWQQRQRCRQGARGPAWLIRRRDAARGGCRMSACCRVTTAGRAH